MRDGDDGYALGIDCGSSGLKCLVVDRQGAVVARAATSYPMVTPQPGWVEADPEVWWSALCRATALAFARAGIRGDAVAGVGFSGQMHTLVLLDEGGIPLRPAISWADSRGAAERAEIAARVGRERLITITGSPAVTAFTVTKLLWVRRHQPEIWERARTALLPKDYLRYRLTGRIATDPTDAGATGLLDIPSLRWSHEILQTLDLSPALLPEITSAPAPAGETARPIDGLPAGIPVATGAGDQEAAALGCGVVDPGPVLVTLGTGGQVFTVLRQPVIDRRGRVHTLPHALPGRWHILAAIPAAGLALNWMRGMLGHGDDSRASSSPPIFLPSLAGERTPTMDDRARGLLWGLDLSHQIGDLLFAAREGVAFAIRACLDVLEDMQIPMSDVLITGGLSNDGAMIRILADVLGRPLQISAQEEGSGYGAALLGWQAAGSSALGGAGPTVARTITPLAANVEWHAERYALFRELGLVSTRPALVERESMTAGCQG